MKSYLQLFLSSIKAKNNVPGKSVVVAFTSSQPGEGVSYVVNSFAVELAERTRQRTLIADVEDLQCADIFQYERIAESCQPTDLPYLYSLASPDGSNGEPKNLQQLRVQLEGSKLERGLNNLQTLRFAFDFILLDCSALSVSGDAALFAPATDGVVLVVEANRVRKSQVSNSLHTLETANGNVLGCVMNKRRYPVPNWLYQRI